MSTKFSIFRERYLKKIDDWVYNQYILPAEQITATAELKQLFDKGWFPTLVCGE